MGGRIHSLQVLRFFAALMVVHLHAVWRTVDMSNSAGLFGAPATLFGRAGVDVFFVLSGLIIAITARGLTPGEFATKRAQRIVPIYVLMSLPWVFMWVLARPVGWRDMAATFLFWPATDQMTAPLMPVGWTLCFEALFYVAAGLVLWRPKLLWVLGSAFLAALAYRGEPVTQFLGNPIIFEFLAGVALAYAPRCKPLVWAIPLGLAILVAGAVFGWPPGGGQIEFLRGDDAWVRLLTLGAPAILIVAGTLQIPARPGVLSYLGDASYSLYLIHPLVLMAVAAVLKGANVSLAADVFILLGMALSVLAAWRIHEAVEKPMLSLLRRRPLLKSSPATP